MDNVKRCTRELTEAIRSCSAYRRFEDAKKKVKEHPGLQERLDQFRKENYQLQNSKDGVEWYKEIAEFQQKNEEFHREPLVREYLDSELELCRALQHIAQAVMGMVQLEIESFADEIEM